MSGPDVYGKRALAGRLQAGHARPYAAAGLLFPRILHLEPEGRAAANGAVNAEGEAVLL